MLFCFMLKAHFVSEIFAFLSWLFGYVKNGLIRKLSLISKFMRSDTGQQIVAICILLNISRSKGNHTMKFGQLIEYNMRNTFLEISYLKLVEKLVSDPFIKNQNWAYLWINSLKYYEVCFYCMTKSRSINDFYKSFLKNKKRSGLVSLPHFLHDFWRKIFFLLYFIKLRNFIGWLTLLLEISRIMRIVIICCAACDVKNFGIDHTFLMKPFCYITNSQGKNLQNRKKSFTRNAFHHFQRSEIVSDPSVGL